MESVKRDRSVLMRKRVAVVRDMSLSFLYYIYSGDRKYDDTMKMHPAKWYLAQTTQMPPNALYAP